MFNSCNECGRPATQGWQRFATDAELAQAKADPNTPSVLPHETSALIQVLACDKHALPLDLAARVHDATCPAPPTCPCSVAAEVKR